MNFPKLISAVVLIAVTFLNFSGCDKKTEPPKEEKPTEIIKDTIPDITGVWRGKFEKRDFTLTVTSQDGNNFQGKTVIKYREQINQEILGTFDVKNLEITMKDSLHSRYAGSYKGKISEDWKTITGKFTVKVDGNKFDFNLKHE